jgi:hypothetical protein
MILRLGHTQTDPSVIGVNLVDPLSAPKVIKTWDERLDETQYVESGVDDEVSLRDRYAHQYTRANLESF